MVANQELDYFRSTCRVMVDPNMPSPQQDSPARRCPSNRDGTGLSGQRTGGMAGLFAPLGNLNDSIRKVAETVGVEWK